MGLAHPPLSPVGLELWRRQRAKRILLGLSGELRLPRYALIRAHSVDVNREGRREVRFAADSLLEGAVTSEPVSEAEIPC